MCCRFADATTSTTVGSAIEPVQTRNIRRVLVLGLGNILLKDEGIGVHVVQKLREFDLPDGVEIVDAGTAGLDVLLTQKPDYELVVVDAMRGAGRPGTVYKARFADAQRRRVEKVFGGDHEISLHQVGLIDALTAADRIGRGPGEVVIIGVEPAQVDWGLELTEGLKESIPKIVNAVLEEVENAVY
jgi:hydrogenase maturation protease